MRFFLQALFASLAAATVVPQRQHCGAIPPPPEERKKVDAAIAAALKNPLVERQDTSTLTISVYWHTLNGDSTVYYVYEENAQNNIDLLNARFKPANIQFTLAGFDHWHNNSWADHAHGSEVDYEMKLKLRKGPTYRYLNIYSVDVTRSGQDPFDGFGTFPYYNVNSRNYILDGVTLVKDVLVGGARQDRHLGTTVVHEVGHWLNLYHVFATNSCDDQGDDIADTYPQSSPSYGCPQGKDSCPHKDGLDNIHNYMDYSQDSCRIEFTPDQIVRARHAWSVIR